MARRSRFHGCTGSRHFAPVPWCPYAARLGPDHFMRRGSRSSAMPLPMTCPISRGSRGPFAGREARSPCRQGRAEQRRGAGDIRVSEGRAADKFANVPREPSSARKPAGPRTSARLSFAYFSLAEQRKVGRPPGRDPAHKSHERNRVSPPQTAAKPTSPRRYPHARRDPRASPAPRSRHAPAPGSHAHPPPSTTGAQSPVTSCSAPPS